MPVNLQIIVIIKWIFLSVFVYEMCYWFEFRFCNWINFVFLYVIAGVEPLWDQVVSHFLEVIMLNVFL